MIKFGDRVIAGFVSSSEKYKGRYVCETIYPYKTKYLILEDDMGDVMEFDQVGLDPGYKETSSLNQEGVEMDSCLKRERALNDLLIDVLKYLITK